MKHQNGKVFILILSLFFHCLRILLDVVSYVSLSVHAMVLLLLKVFNVLLATYFCPTLFKKMKCDSNCVLNRVATQGSKEQPKDVLVKTKEALVCFDTQFFGLLQEF